MPPTLVYFDFPVRAEVARLLFTLGKTEFEDKRISFEEWPQSDWKPKCTFGQVPILEVDGKCLAQSAAIDRYVAQLTGMMPKDPLQVAVTEQAYFFCEDLFRSYYPTFKIQDADERVKARQALLAGDTGDKLKLLSKLLASREGKFITGDQLTHGDLQVFCHLGLLNSGWIEAFYSKETDDIRVKGFRPAA